MPLAEATIRSSVVGNQRRVWLQRPTGDRPAEALCVLLDGEYYVERMNAPALISQLEAAHELPPLLVAYISHVDGPTRWRESFCDQPFSRFVAEELLPWVNELFQVSAGRLPTILGGLSLTGLAAAYAGLRDPDVFTGILCQSASFWWSENWIVDECRRRKVRLPRFRISCGSLETSEYVEHGPELIQRISQLASNRAMRDALREQDCCVSYEEFAGGHDLECWRDDLPCSLRALLAAI